MKPPITFTIEIPDYLLDRFITVHEKAHGVALTPPQVEREFLDYMRSATEMSITRWAIEHKTIG
jgi:hypothetical protein